MSLKIKNFISFLGILLVESLAYGKIAYSTIILFIYSLILSKYCLSCSRAVLIFQNLLCVVFSLNFNFSGIIQRAVPYPQLISESSARQTIECNEKKVKSSPMKWSCSPPGVTLTIWIQISPYITQVKVGNHTFNNFSCFRVIYMLIVPINQERRKKLFSQKGDFG